MPKRLLSGRRTAQPASFLCSCLLLALLLVGGFSFSANAQSISGTKTIPGDYVSLTAAFVDLTAKGVNGPVVLELQPGYAPVTAETSGGISYSFAGGSATNTVTIRPAGAATNLSIGGTVAGPMLSINGGRNLIIDGRPGGSGAAVSGATSATDLSISNSSTDASSAAVSFVNDAGGNVVQHCQLSASTSGATAGAVVYFGAASAGGNSGNTLQYNDIRESSGGTPTAGVLSTNSKNAGNTIAGNNIFNFFAATAYGLYLSAAADGWNITGNSLYQSTNRAVTSAFVLYGINVSAGFGHTIAGNFIGGLAPGGGAAGSPFTLSGSTANRFVGISLSTSSASAASSIQGNTVANIAWTTSSTSATTSGVFSGIYVAAGNADIGTTAANSIGTPALPITVSASATGAAINGIGTNSTSVGALNIAQNTIANITSSRGVVRGLFLASATSATISRNRIFNLASTSGTTSLCYGLDVQATSTTLANNLVADLRAPAATGTSALIGINLPGAAASTANVYYNTVYLASASGSGGSSALFASTTVALTLRNNILVNNPAAAVTGVAVAYRRSAAGLTSYASASDNNLLYGGSPASLTRLLFSDGTAAVQTLAAYKTFMGPARDQYSVTELPPFQNTAAPDAATQATLLHLKPGVPTQVEKGGLPIADFPSDFDNDLRDTSFPDLGADEGSFAILDKNYPYFRYAALGNGPAAASRTFANVVIADPSGLAPISSTAGPLLYYRKGSTDNFVSVPATAVSGTGNTLTYTFTFNYSLLAGGGVAVGDRIEYYLAAQDNATPANGGTSPVNNAAPIANTSPPGSALASAYTSALNSFAVVATVPATVYVGTDPGGGATFYPSLTKAGGLFEALNKAFVAQSVTAIINANLANEDGVNALNALSTDGSYTLTIQSDGPMRTISGAGLATAAAPGLIRFSGAQNVTVSGGTGTARNLLFRNTLAAGSPTIAFLNDASYNTLTNCIIEGGNAATLTELNPGTVAFYGGATGNRNNLINACDIGKRSDAPGTNPYVAVYSGGTTGNNSNNTLQNSNLVDFGNSGIYLAPTGGGDNWVIGGSTTTGGVTTGSGNNLYLTAAATSAITAINIAGGASHTVSYNNLYQQSGTLAGYTGIYASAGNGLVIAYNRIGGAQPNAGGAPLTMGSGEFRGIHLLVGPGSAAAPYALVQHNVVRNLTTGAGATSYAYGIYHNSGAANISDNTIGDAAPAAPAVGFNASFSAYGIYLSSSTPSLVANNAVAGLSLGSGAPQGNTLTGIYCANNSSGSHTVSGNMVSDLRVLSGTGSGETLYGIYVSTAAPVLVQNNVIKRLEVANGAGVNCTLGGINVLGSGAHSVLSNAIGGAAGEGLVNASNVSSASGSNTVLTAGIQAAGTGLLTVAGNTVSDIGNTSTFVPTSSLSVNAVFGIALLNATSGTSLIRSNRVQNLSNTAPANPAAAAGAVQEGVQGLALRGTTAGATVVNNQVSLIGSGSATGPVAGIVNAATGAANKLYFNSVYLSGITGAGIKTYALRHNSSSTAAGLLQLRNNVLVNERTGGAGNFALGASTAAAAVTVGTTGAAVVDTDYNDLYASEAAAKQAENGATAYAFGRVTPAAGWLGQAGSPDAHSQNVNVKFINALTSELALDATTNCSLNNAGLALAGVDGEYDNPATSRQITPDLGADEFSPVQQTATLASTGSACGPTTASVTLPGNGGPFFVTYTDGATPVTATAVTSPFTFATAPGKTYTLTSVTDSYGCSLGTAGSVTVTDQTTYTGAAPNDGSNWFNPANWTACVPSNTIDALIPGGLSNYPDLNTAATAAVRSLTLAPGARFTQRAGTLSVSANLTNDATNVNLTGGTAAFVGSAAQTLGGTAPLSFFNLTVNKSSDTLYLATNQAVSATLALTSGVLKTYALSNTHKVTLAGALTETPTSFVLGDVEVPAADLGTDGATTSSHGLGLTLTAHALRPDGSPAALPGLTTVVRSTGTPLYGAMPAGGPASRSIRRRYAITPVNDANLNVDLVFGYNDSAFELNSIAEPSLRLFSAPVLAGQFRPEGGTLDAAANTVTKAGLDHLSVWTLGDAAAPLPVELVRFEAVHQGPDAALTWTTASERNNRGFEVQVSTDGRQFRPLGFVAGAGTSSTPHHYAYPDREARKTGWRYYRLRQTDADGTAAFSPVRSLDFAGASALLEASPVPFSTALTLTLHAPQAQPAAQFTLTDATGRIVLTQLFDAPAGTSQLPVGGIAALPTGLYLVQLVLNGQSLHLKVIKQ